MDKALRIVRRAYPQLMGAEAFAVRLALARLGIGSGEVWSPCPVRVHVRTPRRQHTLRA
jgi:hypothetical protein